MTSQLTSDSGRHSFAPSANPPPTPRVPKAPEQHDKRQLWVTVHTLLINMNCVWEHELRGRSAVLTWVKPTQRASRPHDVRGTANKVAAVGNDDAVVGHELVHTMQHAQGVQVPLCLLARLRPACTRIETQDNWVWVWVWVSIVTETLIPHCPSSYPKSQQLQTQAYNSSNMLTHKQSSTLSVGS